MKILTLLTASLCLLSLAFGQKVYKPGHTKKDGTWVEGKWTTSVHHKADHTGKHREHRYYPGHYAADGHWIKPHSRWVWVKD